MLDPRDVLLKAASRLEEEGMWCQGNYWPGFMGKEKLDPEKDDHEPEDVFEFAQQLAREGRRLPECIYGTLFSTVVEMGGDLDDLRDTNQYLERFFSDYSRAVYSQWVTIDMFNDDFATSAHDVAEVLRLAATDCD